MKKLSKKQMMIGLCALLAVVCIAVAAVLLIGQFASKSKNGYTVTFELCTDLKTTTVLDRQVEPGAFLEEPEVYVTESNEENWEIKGWYREPEYETQWDFDFDTVESDLTLYAKWATNPMCTVNFYAENSDEPILTKAIKQGLTIAPCDEEFVGREVLGYYSDRAMTKEFDFDNELQGDTDIYVELSEYVYFNAKMISKWNVCGDQSEIDAYEVATSLSKNEDILTVTSKNGGFLWLSNLKLALNGTSLIQIKAREVNGNHSGVIGGYVMGSYTVNGEPGASAIFGQPNTGSMSFSRSAKPDEDGFYTYTYAIGNLTPGLVYSELTGIRIDFYGTDKYTYEIKEIQTFVDEYAVSGEAFDAKGLNFTGLHINTFSLMEEAETEMLENGDLRFSGPNGAYIYKKDLNIILGDEQIIRLKAKGDLKGGQIAMFFFGEYTQNGKKGVTTDFSDAQKIAFVAGETDSKGYTVYTADLSTLDLTVDVLHGVRLDLWGEGTRRIEIQSLKSYAPTKEEIEIEQGFKANGLDLKGSHLATFNRMEGAEGTLLANGDYEFGGPNGAYIYRKDIEITLGDEQIICLKAKGDLKNGQVATFFYGEYIQDGKTKVTTDFSDAQKLAFVAGETDADGYTTYTADISTLGVKVNVLHGIRFDLWGEGTRSIKIQSVKSVAPSKEEEEAKKAFVGRGVDFAGAQLAQFNVAGSAETALLDNGDYQLAGPNGAMIYYDDMEITLEDDQIIEMKAKGNLNNGAIALFFCGDYTINGTAGTEETYVAEHRVTFIPGQTDEEGYTTYIADICSAIAGLQYDVLRGLRIDLYGEGTRTIEIKSVKSVAPSKEDEEIKQAFVADGVDFTGAHLAKFNVAGNAQTALLDNGDYKFGGPNGAMIYYDDMEITFEDDQIIEMKAKGDLNNGAIALFFCGDYTINGTAGTVETYVAEHRVTFVAGDTDAEGYTTYTADISSAIAGLQYDVLRGLRIDLYGEGTRNFEIKSVKSVVPSDVTVTYYVGSTSVYETAVEVGEAVLEPADSLLTMGHQILGYYSDEACETVYDFDRIVEEDTNIYVKISDYMYFSPAMLKEFSIVAGPAASATAETELVDGNLEFKAVHGSYIYKKDMNLDVTDTQVIEFTASATVDVSRIDIWLFGTYTKDGQSYTNTVEDMNLRWLITPDTTGEYVTYKLNLSESPKADGMVWEKISGIRIDILLSNAENTGIINIQSIKAVEATDVLQEDFDRDTDWIYTDGDGNKGNVVAQGQEDKVTRTEYIVNGDFESSTMNWYDAGAVPTITAGTGYNETAGLVLTRPAGATGNPYTYYRMTGLDTTGEVTYTVSFKTKAGNVTWRMYAVETGSDNWQAIGDYSVAEWTTYSYQFTTKTGVVQLGLQLIGGAGKLYVDDFAVTYETVKMEAHNVADNADFESSTMNWYDAGAVPTITAGAGYNETFGLVLTRPAGATGNPYTYYRMTGLDTTGEVTYTVSFKTKAENVTWRMYAIETGSDNWQAIGDYSVPEWTTYSYQFTTKTGVAQLGLQLIGGAGKLYVDDFKVTYDTQACEKTYTEGIGTCNGVEEDNVLYVKDYAAVETAAEIKAGVTYKYTFLMRNDATGSDFDFDVQVGGAKVADVVSGSLASSAWTEVSGTFVATADATTFGFLRSGDGGVYIDDIVLTKLGTSGNDQTPDNDDDQEGSQPENTTGLVVNGSFENTSYDYTMAWRVQGATGQMAIVADPDDADNRVLQFTASDGNSGIDYNAGKVTGFLEKDKTYTISFKYKGEAQFHIFTQGLTSAGHTLLDDWVPQSASGWTTYTCEITPSIDTTASEMQFYIKMATETGGTIYIDDFSITEKAQ